MKKYGKYIAAYLSSFAIFLMGIVLESFLNSNVIITVLFVLALLPILLFVINIIFSKQILNIMYKKKAFYDIILLFQIRRHGQAVRQRSATPLSPVRFRVAPPKNPARKCGIFTFYLLPLHSYLKWQDFLGSNR